jgi:polar amino acid transport system permease protein
VSVEEAATIPERERPDRGVGHFISEQRPLSVAAALIGAASLLVLLVGTIGFITTRGWTPSERLAGAISSTTVSVILVASLALGVTAAVLGFTIFRRLDTKPSREAAIAGAVVGIQTLLLGGVFAWFRAGDVAVFSRNFFEFSILSEFFGRFVRGAVNTVILALSGEGLGIVIGLVFAVFALSHRAAVRAPVRVYINFFRGTPLLWQLTFGFFGIVLGLRLDITAYQAAILVLGLNAGAYSAEIFRAGIQSIERAQMEAARSLGMSYLQALRYVILPQAFRRVIPPLTNEFVILIKDTSLVAFLGLTLNQQELLSVGRDIFADTFNATAFLGTAAGYLAITLPMIRAVTALERRLRSGLTGIGA